MGDREGYDRGKPTFPLITLRSHTGVDDIDPTNQRLQRP